nr:hypothetical protein Iba_chr02bCG1730 [Ipomoea batatas]
MRNSSPTASMQPPTVPVHSEPAVVVAAREAAVSSVVVLSITKKVKNTKRKRCLQEIQAYAVSKALHGMPYALFLVQHSTHSTDPVVNVTVAFPYVLLFPKATRVAELITNRSFLQRCVT